MQTSAQVLWKKYHITPEEWEGIYEAQGEACAGCGYVPKDGGRRLSVDHDHKTKHVRGLLCWRCNTVLGWARDNPKTLKRLADYLEMAQRNEENVPDTVVG